MHESKLINIIGIDGAGKTTLAKSLEDRLKLKDKSVKYVYCQYFAWLLLPARLLSKMVLMRKLDAFSDYTTCSRIKKQASVRFKFFFNIYVWIWIVDYIIRIFFKVTLQLLFFNKKIIIDRYIYDTAINISLTLNKGIDYAYKVISVFLIFCPKPDNIFLIDIPEDVAFRRKNDIQDIKYLKERRERYLEMAKKYKFVTLQGTEAKKDLVNDVLVELEQIRA